MIRVEDCLHSKFTEAKLIHRNGYDPTRTEMELQIMKTNSTSPFNER